MLLLNQYVILWDISQVKTHNKELIIIKTYVNDEWTEMLQNLTLL